MTIEAVTRGDQYLWGRDILVAPVVERGATRRSVYLPEGRLVRLLDEREARRRPGNRTRRSTWKLCRFSCGPAPFCRLTRFGSTRVNPTDEPTTVRIYRGRDGEFRLYDDDGASLDYQRGRFAWTKFQWNDESRRLTIEPDGGEMEPPSRALVCGTDSHRRTENRHNTMAKADRSRSLTEESCFTCFHEDGRTMRFTIAVRSLAMLFGLVVATTCALTAARKIPFQSPFASMRAHRSAS